MTTGLKLRAESQESLTIISAALQDAILQVGDIRFDKNAHTLTLRASRYMHEQGSEQTGKRIQCGVQFHNILSVQAKDIVRADPKAYIVLLSIEYEEDKTPPGGELCLRFAGGGELRLQAEYIELHLVDYLQTRDTDKQPLHPDV
ncbi:MAG: hypothetical protein COA43_11285 [Robiginitomaculum sp.]|nr:MAG: hypothetical protein COA43_11285 [Robiginitomaculum sp.]